MTASTAAPAAFTPTTLVGTIATEQPLATRVFARHGIDFCCGGGQPLADACRARGLDPAVVLREIAAETAPAGRRMTRWRDEPVEALVDHLLAEFHAPLWAELPRLDAMAAKVLDVHGAKAPEQLGAVRELVTALRADLEPHMQKEEQVLFPMIRRGRVPDGPIAVMEAEHEAVGALLVRLREVTDQFRVPAGACNTWRALWAGLEALERDLHEHIHLENNVLFPRLQVA
jgi:regulator of cell morphogenesis and NO signaling